MDDSVSMSRRIEMLKAVAYGATMAQKHAAIAYNHRNIISMRVNSKETPVLFRSTHKEHISCHAEEAVLRDIPQRLLSNQRKKRQKQEENL